MLQHQRLETRLAYLVAVTRLLSWKLHIQDCIARASFNRLRLLHDPSRVTSV